MHAWPIKSRHYGYWFFLWLKCALLVQTNCQFGNLINCSLCITRWTSESWTVYLWLWAWSKSLWSFLLMQFVWCVIRHIGIISSSFKGNIYFCIFSPHLWRVTMSDIHVKWQILRWGPAMKWHELIINVHIWAFTPGSEHSHAQEDPSELRPQRTALPYSSTTQAFISDLWISSRTALASALWSLGWPGCYWRKGVSFFLESEELYFSIQLRWWVHSQNWVCGDDGLLMLTC